MKPLDFLDKPEFNRPEFNRPEFNNQEFNKPEFNKPLVSDQKNVSNILCEFIDDLFGTVFMKNYYENIKKNK